MLRTLPARRANAETHDALVARVEAGRELCVQAIRRYVPDEVFAWFQARRIKEQLRATAEMRRQLRG